MCTYSIRASWFALVRILYYLPELSHHRPEKQILVSHRLAQRLIFLNYSPTRRRITFSGCYNFFFRIFLRIQSVPQRKNRTDFGSLHFRNENALTFFSRFRSYLGYISTNFGGAKKATTNKYKSTTKKTFCGQNRWPIPKKIHRLVHNRFQEKCCLCDGLEFLKKAKEFERTYIRPYSPCMSVDCSWVDAWHYFASRDTKTILNCEQVAHVLFCINNFHVQKKKNT